jgi:hypothetical protein
MGIKEGRAVLVVLLLMVTATSALSGCLAPMKIVKPHSSGGPSNNGTEGPQWRAFDFGCNITPAAGSGGRVLTFTYEETQVENGSVRMFRLQSRCEGAANETLLTNRTLTEINMTNFQVNTTRATVTNVTKCNRVGQKILVLRDDTNSSLPMWADVVLSLPCGASGPSGAYQRLWSRANYSDIRGNTGLWSYHVNGTMWNEMNSSTANRTVAYSPYIMSDGLRGFDSYSLEALYGFSWYWFGSYANGGPRHLDVGTRTVLIGSGSYTSTISRATRTSGSYNFDSYEVKLSWTDGLGSWEYSAVVSPELPIPLLLKVGDCTGGHSLSYEYVLSGLSLG